MKRSLLAVLALALAVPAVASAQGTTEIQTRDDFFEPENVSAEVGSGSFHWAWGPPGTLNQHNVREDNRLFYSGPVVTSGEFTVTPSAGSFHYYCEIHGFEGGGMDGELRIKPVGSATGKKATVTWANAQTDTGTQFDVRQKVGKKKPVLVEERTRDPEGTFKLKAGKNQFQVRSRQGKITSDWSPKLNLTG